MPPLSLSLEKKKSCESLTWIYSFSHAADVKLSISKGVHYLALTKHKRSLGLGYPLCRVRARQRVQRFYAHSAAWGPLKAAARGALDFLNNPDGSAVFDGSLLEAAEKGKWQAKLWAGGCATVKQVALHGFRFEW